MTTEDEHLLAAVRQEAEGMADRWLERETPGVVYEAVRILGLNFGQLTRTVAYRVRSAGDAEDPDIGADEEDDALTIDTSSVSNGVPLAAVGAALAKYFVGAEIDEFVGGLYPPSLRAPDEDWLWRLVSEVNAPLSSLLQLLGQYAEGKTPEPEVLIEIAQALGAAAMSVEQGSAAS
jgi:hypothetical protein